MTSFTHHRGCTCCNHGDRLAVEHEKPALHRLLRWTLLSSLGLFLAGQTFASDPITIENIQRKEPVSFENEVLPILRENCLACHSAGEKQGNLVLESPQGMLKGGDTGPVAIPGRGAESLIVQLASHQDGPVMPPEDNDVAASNLTPTELGILQLWIDQGAKGSGGIDSLSPKQWQPLPLGVHPVQAIALSEDGQFIACSRANQIFLYHVPTGQLVTKLSDASLDSEQNTGIAHRDMVQSLTFNVGGDLLASGGFREVKLWRRPEDVQQLNLSVDAAASAVVVSPDKQWIAVGTANHTIQLFNARDGKPGPLLSGHSDKVTSLRFTSDGQRLVSGSADGNVRVWSVADGSPTGILETPAAVNAIELVEVKTSDGNSSQFLATGDAKNTLRTWELPEAMPSTIANAKKSVPKSPSILKMVASWDGSQVALLHADKTIQVLALSQPDDAGDPTIASWQPEADVSSMAFLSGPDETTALMTGGATGSTQLWSLPDHVLLATWFGEPEPTTSVTVSNDGKQAATGYANGTITLWNTDQSDLADSSVTMETNAPVKIAVLSPSRKLLAAAGIQNGKPAIFLRNLEKGTLAATLLGHTDGITNLSFSANESRIASSSTDKTIRIWDLGNPAVPQVGLLELASPATTVAANDDGSQILAGFDDKALRLYQVSDGEVLKEFTGHGAGLIASGFIGPQPFSISADKSVRFWNPADGTQARTFSMPTDITAFALSDDQSQMAFGCADKQIRLVQADNGTVLQTLQGPDEPVTSIAFSTGTELVSVLSASGSLSVWDVATGKFRESIQDPTLTAAWFENDKANLSVGDTAGHVSTSRLRYSRNLVSGTKPIKSLLFQSDGQLIFMADADGALRGYNTTTGQQTFSTSHGSDINDVAISPDQKILATAGENGVLRLWQPNGNAFKPSQIDNLPGPIQSVAFSPDSTKIIASTKGESHTAHVFDVNAGSLLQTFTLNDEPMVGSIAPITPAPVADNAKPTAVVNIVTVSGVNLHRWEATPIRVIAGHSQPITSLAADPARPIYLFSGSLDGTVRRWKLDSGQSVQQINHGGPVTSIAVSPDGQRLASASDNRTAKLFRINGQLITEMRGDLRLKVELQRRQQESKSANARLVVAKRLLDDSEKDIPKKTEAEKKLAESLAAANKEVAEKQATLTNTNADKLAAEKKAIEASSASKSALEKMEQAELLASNAAAAFKTSQDMVSQLNSALQAQPDNEQIKQLSAKAQQDVTARQQESQQLAAAIQSPTKNSVEMSLTAKAVAKIANDLQKPFNDAASALKLAESAQNLLSQQHAIAAKEMKSAQDLVPVRKASLGRSEVAKTNAETAVTVATEAVKTSELPIRSIAFSPDGSLLATAGDFLNFHTWDGNTGKSVAAFGGHSKELSQVVFLDDKTIVSASGDQTCRIWELNPSWVLERTIGKFDDPDVITHRATAVDFNRDSTQLIVASGIPSRSGELHVFNVADGTRSVYLPRAHDDVIYSAKFSPDGKRIATGGADRYLRTFDLASSKQLRRFEGHTNYVLGVAWKSDGEAIATSSADNTIKIWEAETGDQRRTINQQLTKHITAIQFVGDTGNVVSSSGDKRVRIHNGANGAVARTFSEMQTWLHCVAMTPDSTVVAAGDAGGTITIWNGTNGQQLQNFSQDP